LETPGRSTYFDKVIVPYLRELWPNRVDDLSAVLTFPLQRSQPFAGVGDLWKWDNETIGLVTKRVIANELSRTALRFKNLCYTNCRDLLKKWGDLPIDLNTGVDFNRHPFVTVLSLLRMRVMNLSMEIERAPSLDELMDLINETYVPDPLATSYRTMSRERELKKAGRILQIREYLTRDKELPD
jgi:hypothetical protein